MSKPHILTYLRGLAISKKPEEGFVVHGETHQILEHAKGTMDRVQISPEFLKGNILYHNHSNVTIQPDSTCLSYGDLLIACDMNMKAIWAVTDWGACIAYGFPKLEITDRYTLALRQSYSHFYKDVKRWCNSQNIKMERYQFNEEGNLKPEAT